MSATGPLFLVNPAYQVLTKRTGEKPPTPMAPRVNVSAAAGKVRVTLCDGRYTATADLPEVSALKLALTLTDVVNAIRGTPTTHATTAFQAGAKRKARVGFRPQGERD